MPLSPHYTPAPVHPDLGPALFDEVRAASFPEHRLRWRHDPAAESVGLADLEDEEWVRHFGRLEPLPGNLVVPLALRYHGHQFRHYNPDLGDGRGFLFAQLREKGTARLLDLGTKGSGTTPWSRGGDGRLTLQGGVREVLAAELLAARGVPTCRIFSLVETGEPLHRHDERSPTRSAVMVRLSHSHIRFGTFQRLAWHRDADSMRRLLDHVVTHHYPHLADSPDLPTAVLRAVSHRAADTAAAWMAAGYVHGVLNTDNMNVTGESFDYGPWRAAVDLDPAFTAAYFDHAGLYAYDRQPGAVLWNLQRLALALTLIGDPHTLGPALEDHPDVYAHQLARRWLWRLGLREQGKGQDIALVDVLLSGLRDAKLPIDRFVHDWAGGPNATLRALSGPLAPLYKRRWFAPLRDALESRASASSESRSGPLMEDGAPVGLPIERVRAIWARIDEDDDWTDLYRTVDILRSAGAWARRLAGPPPALS